MTASEGVSGEELCRNEAQSGAGNQSILGSIEEVGAHGIRGWAASSAEDDDHLLVEAFVDGELRGLAWADRPRLHSSSPAHSADRHGFAIELAPPIAAGDVHRLQVYAIAASGSRAVLPICRERAGLDNSEPRHGPAPALEAKVAAVSVWPIPAADLEKDGMTALRSEHAARDEAFATERQQAEERIALLTESGLLLGEARRALTEWRSRADALRVELAARDEALAAERQQAEERIALLHECGAALAEARRALAEQQSVEHALRAKLAAGDEAHATASEGRGRPSNAR